MKDLKENAKEYINLRRNLGYKLLKLESILNKFCSFMEQKNAKFITTELAFNWSKELQNAIPSYWGYRLSIVRRFAQYMKAIDTRHEIPTYGILPSKYHRSNPYIYSKKEVLKLLNACESLTRGNGLGRHTYYTLFGLLAVTGMRISEVTSLAKEDVNLTQGIITIRQTKFNKTRIIPLHKSTIKMLHKYIQQRDKIHPSSPFPNFFLKTKGIPLATYDVRETFIRFSYKIGFRKPTDSHGPRIHDFRHTFAVNTIIKWYQEGVDVESKIPILSMYLGHTKPSDTYWYLSSVPEIIALAASRLEKHTGGRL